MMKNQKNNKEKIGLRQRTIKFFAVFMVFMLACTIISRGIYAMTLPQITVGNAQAVNIAHNIEASGQIDSGAESAVTVQPGILIDKIFVKEGQQVEEGTILMQLNVEALGEMTDNLKKEALAEEAKLNDQKANEKKTEDAQSKEKSRASEDLANAGASGDALVASAQQKNDAASLALSNYPDFKAYLKDKKEKDAKYQDLKEATQKEDESKEDTGEEKNALKDYEKELEKASKTEWETGKKVLEEEAAQKAAALQEAQAVRDADIKKAKRVVEDANDLGEQYGGSILEQQNVMESKKQILQKYQQLLDQNGEIKSTIAGYISSIPVTVGGLTLDFASVIITESAGDFTFTALLDKDQKAYADIGDMVSIDIDGSRAQSMEVPIVSIRQNEEGMYEVSVKIPSKGLILGQSGKMTITDAGEEYDCCVPLSALFAQDNITYVLVLTEKETILGTELITSRVDVQVKDRNEKYAALMGNPVTDEDRIVTASDKEIVPGKEVRESEEE